MKKNQPLLWAVLAGVLAFGAAWGFLKVKAERFHRLEELVSVVTANKDISQGTLLDEAWLVLDQVPRRFFQPSALSSLEEAKGMVTTALILKGEQILETKLVPLSKESGLAARIPLGFRAVSIEVDETSGVADLILPNDFVDVLATFEAQDSSENAQVATYTLLKNILVLAVGDHLGFGPPSSARPRENSGGKLFGSENFANALNPSKKTITLALQPRQAQEIEFARQTGSLSLALRPVGEEVSAELNPTTTLEVMGFKGQIHRNDFNRGQ